MISLWVSQENIFDCDDTGMSAFQISYQQKDVYNMLNQYVTVEKRECFESKYSKQMNDWYDRLENCNTMYCKSQKMVIEYPESVNFLAKSVLQNNKSLWDASCDMRDSLIEIMNEFSSTISRSQTYSFLAFTALKCGSLREGTKTFVPNEADITCVSTHTDGIEILDTISSQSCIHVSNPNAGWSRLWTGGYSLASKIRD